MPYEVPSFENACKRKTAITCQDVVLTVQNAKDAYLEKEALDFKMAETIPTTDGSKATGFSEWYTTADEVNSKLSQLELDFANNCKNQEIYAEDVIEFMLRYFHAIDMVQVQKCSYYASADSGITNAAGTGFDTVKNIGQYQTLEQYKYSTKPIIDNIIKLNTLITANSIHEALEKLMTYNAYEITVYDYGQRNSKQTTGGKVYQIGSPEHDYMTLPVPEDWVSAYLTSIYGPGRINIYDIQPHADRTQTKIICTWTTDKVTSLVAKSSSLTKSKKYKKDN